MKYGRIPGVNLPISRLIMGANRQTTYEGGSALYEDFFERGGTTFDTAYVYGGGLCEQVLGRWIANRDVREKVVILDKGAHTPFCTPGDLTAQLTESLDRLRTDYVDIYMMHRDNPDVPVGEFIDVLNEHRRAGRMRAFGASNWSIPRIEEANAYARARGLTGFAAVSNNLALARMVVAPWPGCLSASDAESRAWLRRTQTPLMAWSSLGRGFFSRPNVPADRSDPELVNSWYSEDNFRRLDRARDLARRRSVRPVQIALAYVLCQPFPVFALIGPKTIEQTRLSVEALEIELSPEELAWLNLEG